MTCEQHTFLPAPAAESSPTSSSDTPPSSPSNGTPIAAPSSANNSPDSESSKEMCAPWTSRETWLESMQSALDFHVKTSQAQARAKGSRAAEAACFVRSCEQSTLFDQPGYSSKTPLSFSPEDGMWLLASSWRGDIPGETESCPRLMLGPGTKGRDGGCLPDGRKITMPTPTASEFTASVESMMRRKTKHGRVSVTLASWVRMWPTVTTKGLDGGSHGRARAIRDGIPKDMVTAGGALNPRWIEWFMGWPIGHTKLEGWVTARSRSKPRSPGVYLEGHK